MAIVRVRGNFDGIVNYLQTGQKSGQAEDRNAKDDRFTLRGNIELLDQIIKSSSSSRIKYRHITISFKEEHIDEKVLKEVVDFYEKLIFCAFRKDEYYYYAEAHIPKIKKKIDSNGIVNPRKPHVHIVVPNLNLKNGKHVNPWGGVFKSHEKFHNAIQEAICAKFGSVSPSLSKRTDLSSASEVIEGYKGDVFLGTRKSIKQKILDLIMEKNISSQKEFRNLLEGLGISKTRNIGKPNEYEAVKLRDGTEFINLRDYVFSQGFFQLSHEAKKDALYQNELTTYYSQGAESKPAQCVETLLEEWRQLRSKQIKYLDGNLPASYRSLSDVAKMRYLSATEDQYYRQLDKLSNNGHALIIPKQTSMKQSRERLDRPLPAPSPHPGPRYDTRISQLISMREAQGAGLSSNQENALVPTWNKNVDIEFLLGELVLTHSLVRGKYKICEQQERGNRSVRGNLILCGTYQLSASDFLTREMRMPWPAARDYLQQVIDKQKDYEPNLNPQAGIPDLQIWRRFSSNLTRTRRELQAELRQWSEELFRSVGDSKSQAHLQKSFDRFTLFQIKMPKHVRELLLALVEGRHEEQKIQIFNAKKADTTKLKINSIKLSNWSLYLSYLHRNAVAVPACLEELRRHSPAKKTPVNELYLRGRGDALVAPTKVARDQDLTMRVKENGDVIYEKNGSPYLRDDGRHLIIIESSSREAIRTAFALAEAKWGTKFSVKGPTELKEMVRGVAVIAGLARIPMEQRSPISPSGTANISVKRKTHDT